MAGGEDAINRVIGQRDSFGAADLKGLSESRDHERADVGIVPELAERLTRRGRDAGIGRKQDEFHPELGEDRLAQRDVEAGLLTQREQIVAAL